MRLPSIFIFGSFLLLLVNCVSAVPPQRLIIQFDRSLSSEQQQVFNKKLESIVERGINVLSHSTDQRWIVAVSPALDETSLEQAIHELIKLEHVQFVEPDQRLKVFR